MTFQMNRRGFVAAGLMAPLAVQGPARAQAQAQAPAQARAQSPAQSPAQAWPRQTIRILHGFAPGGNADVVARLFADFWSPTVSQPVIVESRPGAGGAVAATALARSATDGYTVGILPGGHAVAPALNRRLGFHPVNDFSFIGMLTEFPFVLATHKDHPARNVAELLRQPAARGVGLLFGSSGVGTTQHLSIELFTVRTGAKVRHIPYRGSPAAITDLLGGRIDCVIETPTSVLPQITDGSLRALAVTGPKRFFALPDVPTMVEAGVADFNVTSWLGIAGPANLPEPIVARILEGATSFTGSADAIRRMRELGSEAAQPSPAAFRQRVAADIEQWTKLVTQTGIIVE